MGTYGFGDTRAGRGQSVHIYNNSHLYTIESFALQIDFDPSLVTCTTFQFLPLEAKLLPN